MNIAIILANGNGTRMNSTLPKQFIEVNNKPLIMYSIEAFQKNEKIDRIIVVCKKEYQYSILGQCIEYNIDKVRNIIDGGSTRQESVLKGLECLKEDNIDDNSIVLIHDAARPLISQEIITNNILACEKFDAVNTAINVSDTIFYFENDEVKESINRSSIKASQTPQTFRFKLIYDAHMKYKDSQVTDDVQLVLKMNHKVYIVEGDYNNFKVTTEQDLKKLEMILKND